MPTPITIRRAPVARAATSNSPTPALLAWKLSAVRIAGETRCRPTTCAASMYAVSPASTICAGTGSHSTSDPRKGPSITTGAVSSASVLTASMNPALPSERANG